MEKIVKTMELVDQKIDELEAARALEEAALQARLQLLKALQVKANDKKVEILLIAGQDAFRVSSRGVFLHGNEAPVPPEEWTAREGRLYNLLGAALEERIDKVEVKVLD